MTQLAQSVEQEFVMLQPAENSELRPIPPGTKWYALTTPVLGQRTYKLDPLIRHMQQATSEGALGVRE
jgi:hypothetical protein